jgi:zona occludens toxin
MLITATPGGGKTALAVEIMAAAVEAGRPLYVMGIPDLNLPHFTCPPIAEWTETRTDPDNPELSMPFFTFPPNSLIRAAASKVPDHVAAFETVRHTGVTFLLITQHPNFIDSHIRNLVGQHVHLRDVGLLGRWYYEWPETSDPKTFQSAPIKKRWKLPKKSFALYKSSSLHIKRNYSVPPAMLFMIFAFLFVTIGGYWMYGRIQNKINPEAKTETATKKADATSSPGGIPTSLPANDPVAMLQEFVAVVPGRPETAPAFDVIRQVKIMPRVAGCIQTAIRCTCQNQQGLDAGLDDLQCKNWLAHPPFDPYTEQVASRDQSADSPRARAAGLATASPAAESFQPSPISVPASL